MKLRLFCRLSSSAQTMIANHWLGRDSHCEWDHWFCPSIVTTVAVCNNQWMSFLGSADTFQYTKVLASTRLGWDLVHGCLVVGSVSTMCTSLYLQWVLGCDTVDGCLVVGSGLWHRLWHRHGSKDRWPDALHWFRLPAQIHPPTIPSSLRKHRLKWKCPAHRLLGNWFLCTCLTLYFVLARTTPAKMESLWICPQWFHFEIVNLILEV